METLVICYSLEGSTRRIGEVLAKAAGGELREVKPDREIPRQGFGKYFIGGMQALFKQTPKISPLNIDLAKYDLVLIGTPTWAGHIAPAMRSWLKHADLSGKKVGLYATCQGDVGSAMRDMKALLPGCQVVGECGFVIKPGQEAAEAAQATEWYQQISGKR